jgi:hypothetical protein
VHRQRRPFLDRHRSSSTLRTSLTDLECARRNVRMNNGARRAATRVALDRSGNGRSHATANIQRGCIIPFRGNLQEISREITDGLKA